MTTETDFQADGSSWRGVSLCRALLRLGAGKGAAAGRRLGRAEGDLFDLQGP